MFPWKGLAWYQFGSLGVGCVKLGVMIRAKVDVITFTEGHGVSDELGVVLDVTVLAVQVIPVALQALHVAAKAVGCITM